MAIDTPTQTTTWDKTAGTFDPSVDPKLWAALMARSPLLDMIPRYSVDNFKFSWETDNEPTRTYVLANGSSGIEDGPSATNVAAVFTSGDLIEEGTLLRNATRATPLAAAYNYADEIMEVTANTAGTLVVTRAVNGDGTNGSATAVIGDVFEVLYSPKQEGSSAGSNKYRDVDIVDGYTNILDFYIEVTGSQAATKRTVAADTLANQFNKNLLKLQNDIESMVLYGDATGTNPAGADAYIRKTKGLDQYLVGGYATGVVDYSTKAVTEEALNAVFAGILMNKTDPSDKFVIVCHPQNARVISSFGSDKVQVGIEMTKWGRYIDTFKTDLGITAPVIWTLNCSKSDLFIVDMNKIAIAQFRPFQKATWTYGDDGTDAWRQRYLGEIGLKVVNGLYSHGKLGYLTW